MLCAGAYTSADLLLQGAYIRKCYKWGYYPQTTHYENDDPMKYKNANQIDILWCGRFIDWKHPEAAVELALLLMRDNIDFKLTMIGTGEREEVIDSLIKKYQLEDRVKRVGSMLPDQVRCYMEKADIFLCTSDFQEGWGAVINEAMNSGCAVVASHAAGAVPYLIQNGKNGLIYQSGNLHSLHQKVTYLIKNHKYIRELGQNAYESIVLEWNAKTATSRLLDLAEELKEHKYSNRYESGPCSVAQIISDHWFKEEKKIGGGFGGNGL